MTNDEKLKKVMEKGWNVLIECKSSHRQFPMTYELDATNVPAGYPTILIVGDVLDDCIDELYEKAFTLERLTNI